MEAIDQFSLSSDTLEIPMKELKDRILVLEHENKSLALDLKNMKRNKDQLSRRCDALRKELTRYESLDKILNRKVIEDTENDKLRMAIYKRDYEAYRTLYQQKKSEVTKLRNKLKELGHGTQE